MLKRSGLAFLRIDVVDLGFIAASLCCTAGDAERLRLLVLVLWFVTVIVRDRPRPLVMPAADDWFAKVAPTRADIGPRLLALALLLHLLFPDPVPDPLLLADRRGGMGLGAAKLAKSPILDTTTLSSIFALVSSSTSPACSWHSPGCTAGIGGSCLYRKSCAFPLERMSLGSMCPLSGFRKLPA